MERVLVTGANGFLATNTIRELLRNGYQVRGVVRNKSGYAGEEHPNLEFYVGDFTCPEFMRQFANGCDYVVHCAAMTGQNERYERYHQVNVVATENLIKVAIECKIKKFIYVSSANTFAFGCEDFPGDETRPICKPFSASAYAASKAAAQNLVMTYQDRINVIVVNPTFMLGAYDTKPGSGRIILLGYRKQVIFHPPGGKNFVHVGDVAKGILKALKKGQSGEAYLLANENISYHNFYKMLCNCSGKKSLIIQIPGFLLIVAGAIGNILKFFGIKSEINLTNMKILCVRNYYTNLKSITDLNINYRPVQQAITDALGWFNL